MMQYYIVFAVFIGLILSIDARYDFSIHDCSPNQENSSVTFQDFKISPDPIETPGNLTVSGVVIFNEVITGNLSLELIIGKSLGFLDLTIPLPCVKHLGSCKYEDVCSILEHGNNASLGCADQLVENGFPCKCPFMNGTYVIDETVFVLPEIKGALAPYAQGDYKLSLELKDSDTDEVLGCQSIKFSLTKPTLKTTAKPCDWICQIIG